VSRRVDDDEFENHFDFGDIVEFDGPDGERLQGEVVRVYNTRTRYHLLVDGERYDVDTSDNLKLIK